MEIKEKIKKILEGTVDDIFKKTLGGIAKLDQDDLDMLSKIAGITDKLDIGEASKKEEEPVDLDALLKKANKGLKKGSKE